MANIWGGASANYNTPPRPGPGSWQATPAAQRTIPPPSFSTSTRSYTQQNSQSSQTPNTSSAQNAPVNGTQSLSVVQQNGQPSSQPQQRPVEQISPVERAAKAINRSLDEWREPNRRKALSEDYSYGITHNYEISASPAWHPFQKLRSYPIPDAIFEQLNRAQISTEMGLFAEIHHAWVAIDNALYIWDYTQTNPDLLGFEDQPHRINKVMLAAPKPNIFLPSIQHIVVFATDDAVTILGLGSDPTTPKGPLQIYQTGMTASVRGLEVHEIVCSRTSGRIFFGSRTDTAIRELCYQAQDGWFKSRCFVKDHTGSRLQIVSGAVSSIFSSASVEHVQQLCVDDSRGVLYALSSFSEIRSFRLSSDGGLNPSSTASWTDFARQFGSNVNRELLGGKGSIVAIAAISASQADSWCLVATTKSGARIYLEESKNSTGVGGSFYGSSSDYLVPRHLRTPPLLSSGRGDAQPQDASQPMRYLYLTTRARRFDPGYFFICCQYSTNSANDQLFMTAPTAHQDQSWQSTQRGPVEYAVMVELSGITQDIDCTVPYISPIQAAKAFGDEQAVQFDQAVPEFAILTNTGVHVYRRRRFIDTFAGLLQRGGGTQGLENETNELIRRFGREEILSSALAIACGQGVDVSYDRSVKIVDPEVLELARKVFVDYGGKPSVDLNLVNNYGYAPIDAVRPSPRYESIVRYVARIVRSTWKQKVAQEVRLPASYQVLSNVPAAKLRAVQENLSSLQSFFTTNKSFIRGLSGPDDLGRRANPNDEIALQGEHRALTSLTRFVAEMIEAVSFILVLFEEQVEQIIPLIPSEQSRANFLSLTFEQLVSTSGGNVLAKDLVKAIVNRNIAKGSNVEAIAEALRRKCGNFCSPHDVIIFKGQEQLRRAAENQQNVELGRSLLNESIRLFEQVADSLPWEYLQSAVQEYIALSFFAGAIKLVLTVALASDKENLASTWVADGKPENDPSRARYEFRNRCYDLIHDILSAVDASANDSVPPSLSSTRRAEAYEQISRSTDEVFLANLYDYYISQNQVDRLLASDSSYIVTYLEHKAKEGINHADLLWKYYAQHQQFYEAAKTQLNLAQSTFPLTLDRRIEYLSRARANASAFTTSNNSNVSRKQKQRLLLEINNLIDIATIQSEILSRLRDEPRLADNAQQKEEVLSKVNGPLLPLSDLYNAYADNAGYYDICLYIHFIADSRDASLIKLTWQQFLDITHKDALAAQESNTGTPALEVVIERIREVGGRLKGSDTVFPVSMLVDMLEKYNIAQSSTLGTSGTNVQQNSENDIRAASMQHWVPSLFLALEITHELLYDTLETIYFLMLQSMPPNPSFSNQNNGGTASRSREVTFSSTTRADSGQKARRMILGDLLFVIDSWMQETHTKAGQSLFGSEMAQQRITEILGYIVEQGRKSIGEQEWVWARELGGRVERVLS